MLDRRLDVLCERVLREQILVDSAEKVWWVHLSRRHVHVTTRVLQTCVLSGDISITVENPASGKSWTPAQFIAAMDQFQCSRLNWICAVLEHRIAGPPSLPLTSWAWLHVLLALVLARSCTSRSVHRRATEEYGSRTWYRNILLDFLLLHKRSGFLLLMTHRLPTETLHGDGQHPFSRRPATKLVQCFVRRPDTFSRGWALPVDA